MYGLALFLAMALFTVVLSFIPSYMRRITFGPMVYRSMLDPNRLIWRYSPLIAAAIDLIVIASIYFVMGSLANVSYLLGWAAGLAICGGLSIMILMIRAVDRWMQQ